MDGGSNGSAGVDGVISPTNGGVPAKLDVSRKMGDENVSMKRPYDGSNDSQPEAKKMAADPLATGTPISQRTDGGNSDTMTVPDHLVGLLIGKGGEQIASIQAQTECKIQFAPESGTTERVVTLIGHPAAIQRARSVLSGLVEKMQDVGPPPNSSGGHGGDHPGGHSIEMTIPGSKVGLIIGKGGETIKMLQDRAGVKIMVVQDSKQASSQDKPLRISGNQISCLRAKQMVLDLMAEKDNPGAGRAGGKFEIPVPREKVAMVIGKGGDVIKRIQEQSCCRVQFKPDDGGPTRICTVTGDDHCIDIATNMINDIMEHGTRPGFGRGPPQGGFGGPGPEWGGPGGLPLPGIRGGFTPNGTQYAVPADKCGLVIGKGGETIREINRITGAHMELNRESSKDKHERVFRIQGNPEQINHAIQLIHEKAGLLPVGGGFPGGPPGPMGGPPMLGGPMPGPIPGAPMGGPPNPYGPPASQVPPMVQPGMMAPPQQPAYGQPWGNPYSQPQAQPSSAPLPYAQPAPAIQPTMAAPVPAGLDPSKQLAAGAAPDANAAAWAAYYSQYYGQQAAAAGVSAVPQVQPQPAVQSMTYPGMPAAASAAPAAAPVAAQPQPTINQATGQLDYSAAWAEYYRQQGMHPQAAAILANQALPHA